MKRIMFNDMFGLTQAVLDGRKTMTRRIITNKTALALCEKGNFELIWKYASYKPNEVVAIAQSYEDVNYKIPYGPEEVSELINTPGWNNKRCVKANLMPHHIRITYIGVDRLQNVSWNDCLREGIEKSQQSEAYYFQENGKIKSSYGYPWFAYAALIDKVSGEGTWQNNPYVYVYEFELVD